MTYKPIGGLCNQLVGLIDTFAVAYAVKAGVQLQPSAYRDSFNSHYFDIEWTMIDMSSILNIKTMQQYWSKHGVNIQNFSNSSDGNTSLQQPSQLVVDMKLQDEPARPLLSVANRVHAAVSNMAAELVERLPASESHHHVLVDIGQPTERIKISSHPQVFDLVLKSFVFAPSLEKVVALILFQILKISSCFNGVHLRIENDYVQHPYLDHQGTCNDSLHCLSSQFVPALQRANFDTQTPLYVASGFFKAQPVHQAHVLKTLAPFGKQIVSKENCMSVQQLHSFNSEQLAAIDFMVMRKTTKFVGVLDSSFSKLVARFRETDGHASETNIFAHDFDPARVDLS